MTLPCPDTGTLRALLDHEAPAGTAEHVAACPRCEAELEHVRADADAVTRALGLLAPPPAVPAPPARDDLAGRRQRRGSPQPRLPRRAVAVAAVLVVAIATLGTATGREAAASFLAQFRSERIQVVTIDPYGSRNPLAALGALGEISMDSQAGALTHTVTLEEAEQQTGITMTEPSPDVLPAGFGPEPSEIVVHNASQVRLAFDETSVQAWLDTHGSGLEIPDGLGESVLRVDLPAAIALAYRGSEWGELIVGQAGQVGADSEGPLGLEELRAFLLELPGLDDQTVEQLRAIDDWRTTLPLPVPAGLVDWDDTTVGGVPAVRLRGTSGFGSAILWQDGGVVHGVGGLVNEDVARRIAEDIVR
jgi:hypothetical protein